MDNDLKAEKLKVFQLNAEVVHLKAEALTMAKHVNNLHEFSQKHQAAHPESFNAFIKANTHFMNLCNLTSLSADEVIGVLMASKQS